MKSEGGWPRRGDKTKSKREVLRACGSVEAGDDVPRSVVLTVLFFRRTPRLARLFDGDLTMAFSEDRSDLLQRRVAVCDPAEHDVGVFAGTSVGEQANEQDTDDRDVEAQEDAFLAVTDHVLEVGEDFEPAEEEFDLPAIAIQKADGGGVEGFVSDVCAVREVGEQADVAVGFVGRRQDDLAQDNVGSFAIARAREADEMVGDDAGIALGVGERAFFDDFQLGRSRAGLAQAMHKKSLGVELSLDESVTEDAAVIDVNGARLDVLRRAVRFADVGAVNVDDFGQPSGDIEMDVQTRAGSLLALVGGVLHRPSDVGGEREIRAIDGEELHDGFGQAARQAAFLACFVVQPRDDRLQERGIDDLVEIGQRAAGDLGRLDMFFGLPGLTEILDDAQAFDGGIEEGVQMGEDDIVEIKIAIAMRFRGRLVAQGEDMLVENAQVLGSLHWFRPFRNRRDFLAWPDNHAGNMRYLGGQRKCN